MKNLITSELIGVVFANTNLSGAQLQKADLEEVDLSQANIKKANFREAKNLTPKQIKSACFWKEAIFDKEFQKQLDSSPPVEEVNCSRWQ